MLLLSRQASSAAPATAATTSSTAHPSFMGLSLGKASVSHTSSQEGLVGVLAPAPRRPELRSDCRRCCYACKDGHGSYSGVGAPRGSFHGGLSRRGGRQGRDTPRAP